MPRTLTAACAATFALIASVAAPAHAVPSPSAVQAAIADAPFHMRVEVIATGNLPRAGARGQCFVQARVVTVARGDAQPGAVVAISVPCFSANAQLPSCAFSIPVERLVRGHRFEAAFDGGMLGYTMVNFSYSPGN